MDKDEGFINERTGAYVSPERAHQHVGEEHAFGGYEKAQSKKTGNYYMRETGSVPDYDSVEGLEEVMKPLRDYEETMRSIHQIEAMSTSFPGILSRDGRSGR